MHFKLAILLVEAVLLLTALAAPLKSRHHPWHWQVFGPGAVLRPKVFIISLFTPEAEVWWKIPEFNVRARRIPIPGLSPLFPDAYCAADGQICQIITGEGEINAASSTTALVAYPGFNLARTYFLSAGIGGVNPHMATLGSVMYARFTVQVSAQYEMDIREIGTNFSSGYIPYGTTMPAPAMYPQSVFGTEVYELNVALRDKAVMLSSKAKLNDSAAAVAYRETYEQSNARKPPTVLGCDSATSDNWFSGNILAEQANNYTSLLTNGTGVYCVTAQEDNAILEPMIRAARVGKVDFSRIMVMRAAAAFDRPSPSETAYQHLFPLNDAGTLPSLRNIYLAGIHVVTDIITQRDSVYLKGVEPTNYIGNMFGTLGGKPDFGTYPHFNEA